MAKKTARPSADPKASLPASLRDAFTRPGAEFRGAPFWAWNGRLDPETCRRQVRLMREGGLGGFFMHSRTGLGTPYLSKEWFDCIDACVDEAKAQGMRAWLYDEDRWPSGAAGGLVTKDPRYRWRVLALHACLGGLVPASFGKPEGARVTAAFCREQKAVAVFTARLDGKRAAAVRRVPAGRDPAPAEGESVVFAVVEVAEPNDWYNGFTYLDTLNPAATRRFIQVTHDAYAKDLGGDIGAAVPGIFTDEPNHVAPVAPAFRPKEGFPDRHWLAWTDGLPAAFRALAGYDLVPRLLELAYDVDGADSARLRHDFNNCLTELFVKGFVKQIGDWCGAHGCDFTGHMLDEDTLAAQTSTVGSCMRCYEYMQAPGMDMLTENWRIFTTAKQVSSAARQFGRRWRLTETYGTTGWDFSFAGHKALGDWQAALGINLRCQHLAWYTMKGQAKRDYPASIFYQSPWWPYYGAVEDYFGRVNAAMAGGEEVRDILVVHPVESLWTLTSSCWRDDPRVGAVEASFHAVTDRLLASHLDFDYGDEDILARHGRVRKDGTLAIAKATYRAAVVPATLTLRATTLALLRRFAKAGGLVVFAADAPGLVDALPSKAAAAFASGCPRAEGDALADLLAARCRRVSVADAATGAEFAPALYLLREDAERSYLFICNTGEDFAAAGKVAAQGKGLFGAPVRDRKAACPDAVVAFRGAAADVVELDPATGEVRPAVAVATKDGCAIRTSLPPLASRLFVIGRKAAGAPLGRGSLPALPVRATVSEKPLGATFEPRLSEANVLVLDRPEYRLGDDAAWQPALEILRLDKLVREGLGLKRRQGHMRQPWTIPEKADPRRVAVALRYSFDVEAVPSGDFFVAIESPGSFRLRLNGTPLQMAGECGWWVDESLRKIRVDPALLRRGENVLEADLDYTENFSGLEIVYLLGAFGAKALPGGRAAMTALPRRIRPGDLCGQGLAFYSGNVGYAATVTPEFGEGDRVVVACGDYSGTAVRVLVDGRPAGVAAWAPNEVDITDFVESGRPCEIVVELLGSRRNSHGSLHWHERWPDWHGPNTFEFYPESPQLWQDGYNLVPLGLCAAPRLRVER